MSANIPTREPAQLRAGDTWQWRREDIADYPPADGWTLSYRFRHPTNTGFEIVATADGSAYAVSVPAATSTAYLAGRYSWAAWVQTQAGEIHTIDEGSVELLPNFRAANAAGVLDTRSHARKVLDAIEALIEGRATKDQQQYQIGDRTLVRMQVAELLSLRDRYQAMVNSEEAAERVRNGMRGGGVILARM